MGSPGHAGHLSCYVGHHDCAVPLYKVLKKVKWLNEKIINSCFIMSTLMGDFWFFCSRVFWTPKYMKGSQDCKIIRSHCHLFLICNYYFLHSTMYINHYSVVFLWLWSHWLRIDSTFHVIARRNCNFYCTQDHGHKAHLDKRAGQSQNW